MMVSMSPTTVVACWSVISKGDAKCAKRRWTSSQASASPISRAFLRRMLRPLARLAERIVFRTARPQWTLLVVSYLVSGAVVWAMCAVFGEGG